jgi:hypothetical protein
MKSACAIFCCCLWPVRLYHIFPYYHINGTTVRKKLLKTIRVFWFLLQLLYEKLLILRRIRPDTVINVHRWSCKVPDIVRKVPNNQASWKPVQWVPKCSMRTDKLMDRPDEANSLFFFFFAILGTCLKISAICFESIFMDFVRFLENTAVTSVISLNNVTKMVVTEKKRLLWCRIYLDEY